MRQPPYRSAGPVLILLLGALCLAGCAPARRPGSSGDPPGPIRARPATLSSNHGALQLTYPVITPDSPNARALNNAIQIWIGRTCPLPDTDNGDVAPTRSAAQCMAAMRDECRGIPGTPSPQSVCGMRAHVSVATNAHGILGLVLAGSVYNGGPHGASYRVYRNLRVADASLITLGALVTEPNGADLRALIEEQLRQQYQLARGQPLSAAGFYNDRVPVTDNVLIQPTGLRFTYQPYEIAPYALGEPTAFLTYARLRPLLKTQPPFVTAPGDPGL